MPDAREIIARVLHDACRWAHTAGRVNDNIFATLASNGLAIVPKEANAYGDGYTQAISDARELCERLYKAADEASVEAKKLKDRKMYDSMRSYYHAYTTLAVKLEEIECGATTEPADGEI